MKFCTIPDIIKNIRFFAKTSPAQTRLPAPNGNNLENQDYVLCTKKIFTARKGSLQKLCFTGVCLSTGGMCVARPQARTPPPQHAHLSPGMGMNLPPGTHAPRRILRDELNERAVCILLECILVVSSFSGIVHLI